MDPDRRRFEHLHVELSLAANAPLPRFALWVALGEHGAQPGRLSRGDVLRFCAGAGTGRAGLDDFLAERGLALRPRARRRLVRRVARFDARHPTPEERIAALVT